MALTGHNFIGKTPSAAGAATFHATNPATGEQLQPAFHEASPAEVAAAAQKAADAFQVYRKKSAVERAGFMEAIADEIMALGETLEGRYCDESGLPVARFQGERSRTVFQLRFYAQHIREGSWVNARIDPALPHRQPLPRPDLRSMQQAIGPVGVFGSSNFPLAYSVAGGDTATALAAGCTVLVKAHPAHPGTCEWIAAAILKAAEKTGMPDGVFGMVHGFSTAVGMGIVQHPAIKAVGFTGSFRGGKALFDAAAQRPEPIPVYAEMGSTNPVFILPGALRQSGSEIAKGLAASITLGVGQFCTNPGLTILEKSEEGHKFMNVLAQQIEATAPGVMLTAGIHEAYEHGILAISKQPGVQKVAQGQVSSADNQGEAHLMAVDATDFLANKKLEEEVFGPSTLAIQTGSRAALINVAKSLGGHLTASVFGTDADLEDHRDLIDLLAQKVGRLIINGYPTGVEVSHAMVHGGPFPATTDSRTTSVGTAAILRFTRPVCYQNFPAVLLPDEVKDDNPLNIWRLWDGEWRK